MEQTKKKDILPIILYLSVFLTIQIIGGSIVNLVVVRAGTISMEKGLCIVTIVSYLVTFLIFVIVYHKKLIEGIKKLTINNYVFIAIMTIILLILNYVLTSIMSSYGVEMTNQDTVVNMFEYYKVLMIISVVIFAPVIEELVFRYSIATLIKNEIVFIIISSLIFGILHGIGIVTLIYILLGAIMAIGYLKTNKNIMSSIIIHIINNAFGVITMIILFK